MPGMPKDPDRRFVGGKAQQRWRELRNNHKIVYGEVKSIIESLFPGEQDADLRKFVLNNVDIMIHSAHLQGEKLITSGYIMHALPMQSFWSNTERTRRFKERLEKGLK